MMLMRDIFEIDVIIYMVNHRSGLVTCNEQLNII